MPTQNQFETISARFEWVLYFSPAVDVLNRNNVQRWMAPRFNSDNRARAMACVSGARRLNKSLKIGKKCEWPGRDECSGLYNPDSIQKHGMAAVHFLHVEYGIFFGFG